MNKRLKIDHPGSADVVRLLTHFIDLARQGKIAYAAVVACAVPNKVGCGVAGNVNLEPFALEGLKAAGDNITASIRNRTMPEPDAGLGADYVCYNVALAPLSYDFIAWLVDAEMTRMREGAPYPLKVGFRFGEDGKTGLESRGRREMFDNVVRPALGLIGAVEHPAALRGRHKPLYVLRDVVEAARRGERVPLFCAQHVRGWPRHPVTITLRETDDWPHRNSNFDAWVQFADYLSEQGEEVVFVRDTARSDREIASYATYPSGSRDLHARMALYEAAKANLFVSNGPVTLAMFSRRPWLMFLKLEPDGHPYEPSTPTFWREQVGVEPGGQFPWSAPDQRIVWAADDFDSIVAAWESMRLLCVEATAAAE